MIGIFSSQSDLIGHASKFLCPVASPLDEWGTNLDIVKCSFSAKLCKCMSILVFPFTPFLLDNNQVVTTVSNGHFSHYALYL